MTLVTQLEGGMPPGGASPEGGEGSGADAATPPGSAADSPARVMAGSGDDAQSQAAVQTPAPFGQTAGATAQNPAVAMIDQMLRSPNPQGLQRAMAASGAAQAQISGGVFIAGVASKFEADAIKVYNDRSRYNEWEFVYDYRQDQLAMAAIMRSQQQTAPTVSTPGTAAAPPITPGEEGGFGRGGPRRPGFGPGGARPGPRGSGPSPGLPPGMGPGIFGRGAFGEGMPQPAPMPPGAGPRQ
jgi:hypothetical protein